MLSLGRQRLPGVEFPPGLACWWHDGSSLVSPTLLNGVGCRDTKDHTLIRGSPLLCFNIHSHRILLYFLHGNFHQQVHLLLYIYFKLEYS